MRELRAKTAASDSDVGRLMRASTLDGSVRTREWAQAAMAGLHSGNPVLTQEAHRDLAARMRDRDLAEILSAKLIDYPDFLEAHPPGPPLRPPAGGAALRLWRCRRKCRNAKDIRSN